MTLTIIKIGGQLLNSPDRLDRLLNSFSRLEGPKILVHGGGRRADQLLQLLRIEPKMVNGRRLTDSATLEVVTMVYAGLISKQLVAQLQAKACNAIGICGADADYLLAEKRQVDQLDYGYAGDIRRVNANQIAAWLKAGLVPVCNAITHDGHGQLLNTNADTIAAAITKAMADQYQTRLLYCLDKSGVLQDPKDDTSFYPTLNYPDYVSGRNAGTIVQGMIPKLDNAFSVLRTGAEVWVGRENMLETWQGTRLI